MALFSGLTADSAKHLQLDAGCFIKDYDIEKDFDGNKANIIGATAGGGSFSAVPTIRQIEVDGKKGSVKGFQALDEWVVTLTANVKELTANSLKLALAAAESSTYKYPATKINAVEATENTPATPEVAAGAIYNGTKITGKGEISTSDYSDNIAWVGRISGSQSPVIIIIKNVLATNGLSLTFADKAEAVMAVTLTGHYSLDDLDTPPFEIYYPAIV